MELNLATQDNKYKYIQIGDEFVILVDVMIAFLGLFACT